MSLTPCDPAFFSSLNDLKFPVASGLGAQLYLSTILLFMPFNYKQMQIWQLWRNEHCVFCVRLQLCTKQQACQNSLVGRQHLKKYIFPKWIVRKPWTQNKWSCWAKFSKSFAWKLRACHPSAVKVAWDLGSVSCSVSYLLCDPGQVAPFLHDLSFPLEYWKKKHPRR